LYSGGFQKIKIVQTPEGIVDFQDEGTFDNINSAITVSYGKKVVSNTSVGIAAKIVTRKLDTEQDTMITGDLSLLMTGVKQNLPNLNLAFGIRNLIHMEFNTDDKLPLILKFGVSNKFLKNRLNCAFDFEKNLSAYGGDFGKNLAATPNWAIGLEYWVVNFAALRVGFNGEKEIRESNIGIGLKTTVEEWGDYGLDLAFAMHELGQSFRLSGTWRFGKSYIQNRDATVKRLMQEAIEIVRRGNFLLAYSKFEQAFNVDPTNKDISNSMTRLQEIISFINRATANTEEENAIRKGASSYVESDIQNAINSFRYAYYKNPQNTKLLNLLNQLEKKAGLPVTEAYREEIVGFTMIDKKIYDARQAVMQGKYDEALIRCQEILNLEPKNTTAMEIMGSVFFMMNRPDKAREVWMKVLEIDPTNKIVQQFLNELK
jgi:tetratricopeptide (TPR) repeat protein